MRTYLHIAATLALLVVCLMFAPSRRIIGDVEIAGRPSLDAPAVQTVPTTKSFADLCRDDPVEAIARSMRKYKDEVEGYTCTLRMRERVAGKLREPETVECQFRESPFSVRMHWLGASDGAETLVYVAGENDNMFLVIPASPAKKKTMRMLGFNYARRRLDSPDAKANSRFPPDEFGIYRGTARVYDAWSAAKQRGALRTQYLGLVPVPELDGKPCHAIRRTCLSPEEDGLTQVTIQFDPDTLLQVGAVLMAENNLIARYHFADVKLNPKLEKDFFAAAHLK